jgi:gamma-glutamyltranspeptidase/glutathione hydrolase
VRTLDARETAPHRSTRDMFLDASGQATQLSVTGGMAVGVPGSVQGCWEVHHRLGQLSWARCLEPAIQLARAGVVVDTGLATSFRRGAALLGRRAASKAIFQPQGRPLIEGERLLQPDLARTLEALSVRGPAAFYSGEVARAIAATIAAEGGGLDEQDLADYRAIWREPLQVGYRGLRIHAMPPPSSGGVHVIQILKMLEHDDLFKIGFQSEKAEHLIASAMQLAYADRAKYLGDPDFIKVPIRTLIDEAYLSKRRQLVHANRALKKDEVSAGKINPEKDHFETTHFSLMDREGNAIVSTQTINGWFGSKMIAEGTGIMLNNEMDDFSSKVGASNLYGATAVSNANQIEAGKTPLSSMSPTLIFKDGKPVLALGAPGGTRIITSVTQTILNYLVFKKSLYDSVAAFRIHQQWSPDELRIENLDVPVPLLRGLVQRGWTIKRSPNESHVMAVAREGELFRGVSDPRDAGTSAGGN